MSRITGVVYGLSIPICKVTAIYVSRVSHALQTPVTINTDDRANRMERSCLMIRKLQQKHTIRKLSSWLEVFEIWTRLHFEVRCKMFNVDTKPGS